MQTPISKSFRIAEKTGAAYLFVDLRLTAIQLLGRNFRNNYATDQVMIFREALMPNRFIRFQTVTRDTPRSSAARD